MARRRFTDGRVPDPGVRALQAADSRWQAYLDVEAALALAQADEGVVPADAARAIAEAARTDRLDLDRVRREVDRVSHPLVPLVRELARVTGEPHGGWVHWGVTTQNITQTGDLLLARRVHEVHVAQLARVLDAAADLAERTADMHCAGRTHGQHAVPVTFGFKVAVWADELGRSASRLRELEPRVFRAMVGGAAGTFAGLGPSGPRVQAAVARRLGMAWMPLPARSVADHVAEHVAVLALLATTAGKVGREVYRLMGTEVGEAEEPVPPGTVGSSTMPHKRNPQLARDLVNIGAEVRALVPLAMEGMLSEHEGDDAPLLALDAQARAGELVSDQLERLHVVVAGLRPDGRRMLANLRLTTGLIASEAVMLELGGSLGRQVAHDVVFDAAQAVATAGGSLGDRLAADERVTRALPADRLARLLDPVQHTGLAPDLARQAAVAARAAAEELRRPRPG